MNWQQALPQDGMPRAWVSSVVLKNMDNIVNKMQTSEWFKGVLIHELAHGFNINFMKDGLNNASLKAAFKNAQTNL